MNSILDTYSGEDFLLNVNDNTAKECSSQKTRKGENIWAPWSHKL